MIDILKKLFKSIGWVIFAIVIISIALFSIFVTFGSVFEVLIKIIKIAGFGSIGLGIFITPLFIYGCIQVVRGFCSIFDYDLKKMDEKKESIWNYFYIPVTFLGYISVFLVIYFWGASSQ